jgi:hypothetical protein
MNYNFRIKLSRTLSVLLIILGGVIIFNLINNTINKKKLKEAFGASTYIIDNKLTGSNLNYSIGNGVKTSWENEPCNNNNNNNNDNKITNYDTLDIRCASRGEYPLPTSDLFMFNNTPFGADCCKSNLGADIINVSGSNGCACINKEQISLLTKRGGNRIYPNIYVNNN